MVTGRLAGLAFAMAPIPFGSVDTPWVILWIVVFSVSLVFGPVPRRRSEALWVVGATVLCLALVGAHSVVMVMPSGDPMVADPAWALVRDVDGSIVARASGTRSNPLLSLGPVLLAGLAFLSGYMHGQSARQAHRILTVVAWAGLGIAIYGIVSTLLDTRLILWREKTAYLYDVTGTFVNRNTAATYFGSCAVLWFLTLVRRVERVWPDERIGGARIDEVLTWREMRPVYLAAFGFMLCLGAMIMTGSRGGFLATTIGLVLVGMIYGRRLVARIGWHWSRIALALVAAAVALELLGGTITGRIERDGFYDPHRLEAYRTMMSMIADRPLLGIGLGNFEAVFPRYRSDGLLAPGVWDMAHSTWIEMLVCLGLPLGLLLIGCAGWIGAMLLRGGLARRRFRFLPLAGLGIGVVGAVHSLFDFSLQIPGYTVVFAAVVGCALAQRHPNHPETLPRRRKDLAAP